MKNALLICLLLAAVPAVAQTTSTETDGAYSSVKDKHSVKGVPTAGQEAAEPFKGANTILLHTADAPEVAYKTLARILLENGYAIDKADKELGFINTSPKPVGRDMSVVVQASVLTQADGTLIRLQGMQTWAMAELLIRNGSQRPTRVDYRGMKGSPAQAAWTGLQIAANYPGARVGYIQQP